MRTMDTGTHEELAAPFRASPFSVAATIKAQSSARDQTLPDIGKMLSDVLLQLQEIKAVQADMRRMQAQQVVRSAGAGTECRTSIEEVLQRPVKDAVIEQHGLQKVNLIGLEQPNFVHELDMLVCERLRSQTSAICELMRPLIADEVQNALEGVCSQNPMTCAEMEARLEPMQKCLQRMEDELHKLSHARMADKGNALTSVEDDNVESSVPGGGSEPEDSVLRKASTHNVKEVRKNPDITAVMHVNSASKSDLIERHKTNRTLAAMLSGSEDTTRSFIADTIVQKLEICYYHWAGIEIPRFDNPIVNIVHSHAFGMVCMLAIFFNSFLFAYSADWQIRNIGQDEPQFLYELQSMVTIFFFVELIVRLAAHRIYFFLNSDMSWNIFDFVIVAISLFDFVLQRVAGDQEANNVSFMRILRLCKLARLFRSLRSFRFFKELMIMLVSVKKALLSLFWGFVFLLFLLFMFSLLYAQAFADYLKEGESVDVDVRDFILSRFGSLLDVIITLYMSMTGGEDWGIYYHMIVKVGAIHGFMFLLFTFFFFFGLLNILTGLVVEKAMAEGGPDRSDQIVKRRRSLAETRKVFIKLCESMDADSSGMISYREFVEWMSNPVMRNYMETVGLDVQDLDLFFAAVSKGHASCRFSKEGKVTIANFVDGCLHMKGMATALDMQTQLYEMDILLRNFRHMDNAVCEQLSRIEKALAQSLHSQKIEHHVGVQPEFQQGA